MTYAPYIFRCFDQALIEDALNQAEDLYRLNDLNKSPAQGQGRYEARTQFGSFGLSRSSTNGIWSKGDISVVLATAHLLHLSATQDSLIAGAIAAADNGKSFVHHNTTVKDNRQTFWALTVYGLQYYDLLKRGGHAAVVAGVSNAIFR